MLFPANLVTWAQQAQQATGVSLDAAAGALAVAVPESGGNPAAIGDNGTSYGLTQLHQGGGLGDGYAVADLLDPVKNLSIAMANIQTSLNAGQTLYDALRPWSTRESAWPTVDDARASLGSAPTSTPFGSPVIGGGLILAALVAAFLLVRGTT